VAQTTEPGAEDAGHVTRSSGPHDARVLGAADSLRMRHKRRQALAVAVSLLAALALVGCGSNRPAVCSDVDSLQASVDKLKAVNVRENGLSELSSNLNQVKNDVDQLAKDAKSQYRQEIDDVESAVNRLSSSVSAAKADPTSARLAAVRSGVQDVQSTFLDLRGAVSSTC
jgi:hypothetical protein